jgi:hypothetical protein
MRGVASPETLRRPSLPSLSPVKILRPGSSRPTAPSGDRSNQLYGYPVSGVHLSEMSIVSSLFLCTFALYISRSLGPSRGLAPMDYA